MEPYKKLLYTLGMDLKKKLKETYIPDQKARKERVVVALSGGLDSFVAAYLLKVQKYELLAVTIAPNWDEINGNHEKFLACNLTPSKVNEIKDFCHKLGIVHHIIRPSGEFKENVIGPWIADKALGRLSRPCWNCHELRMKLVYDKMKEVDAKFMATGHFAKVFRNEGHGTVFVHSSNDEQHDQSSLLSRLPHDILSSLVLPLSDLTKKEVLKLAENFGLSEGQEELQIHQCLKQGEELLAFLQMKVPEKFKKLGTMTNLTNNENWGEHEGIFHYALGEKVEYRDNGKTTNGLVGQFYYSDKRLVIVGEDYFLRNKILLTKCKHSEEVHLTDPVKGFITIAQNVYIDCWIHPKSLGAVYIELSEKQKFVTGQIITVFKKKGKNSKVYLTGEVHLLSVEEENVEGEVHVPKVDYATSF